MNKNKFEFIIDSEFQSQIPALTDEEFQQLEENILSEGEVLSPLIVWGNILVDGHNRYKILQQHPEIPYTTRSISCTCETREDVLAWICKHQLGRRNLTPEQKKFLIGKQYHSEKSTRGGNHGNQYTQVANCQIDNLPPVENTTERIAKENNVSPSFVIRAEQFMKTVELMEKYCPGIQEEILSGKLKLSQREATIIRGTPTEALPTVVSTWREEKLNGKPDDSADTYENLELLSKVTERNCILLPIEAESQDTALRIFSTLNDRGKPLSDADIFKAQFYKYYSAKGEREVFIQKWKDLEVLCDSIFHPITGTPMDELFTRYMYYERAKQGIKSSTTEALRKFYERNAYSLLKNDQTFENLINLADFWNDVQNQNVERFSDRILRRLFVLNYAPNGMWTYFVSVYYMANRDSDGLLNDDRFYSFLNKITAFIWAYAVTNPGVNALRTPIFAEMINIVTGQPVRFSDYLFDTQKLQNALDNYTFSNNRAITKAMLTWWAFQNSSQELLSLESVLEIEHIYARNRQEKEHSLSNPRNVESLGNKVLLEKRINIRASDYRFSDKVKYYTGFENNRKQKKEGTKIKELTDLAAKATDFTESDIVERNAKIILSFVTFMRNNDLLCED